jgi:hypothetical protein
LVDKAFRRLALLLVEDLVQSNARQPNEILLVGVLELELSRRV